MSPQDTLLVRLDRLSGWPYKRFLMVIIGVGFCFGFFDIITVGLALPVFTQQFHISNAWAIWTITSSLIGYILGSFLNSRISDVFSRKFALLLSILFFSVGSILSATSPNIIWLIIWRFIIGMGIGSEISNATTYISELSPASSRGRNLSIAVALGFVGIAIAPFVGLALIPNFSWGWRVLFIIGGIGGLALLFFRRHVPEPIRWLVQKNRLQEAEVELKKLEAWHEKRYGTPPPEPSITHTYQSDVKGIKHLFKPRYFIRLSYFAIAWFLYYIANYSWLSLNTKLFLDKGIDLRNSITLIAITSVGFIVGSLFALFVAEKFERKWLLFYTIVIWTITLLLIAFFPDIWVIYTFGFIASMTISIFIPLMYIYTSESFPTAFRATSVSITDGVGHLGGAFCGQMVFGVYYLFQPNGYTAAYTFLALTAALVGLLLLFGKRRNGQALQQ